MWRYYLLTDADTSSYYRSFPWKNMLQPVLAMKSRR
jgi:hypothetical protein